MDGDVTAFCKITTSTLLADCVDASCTRPALQASSHGLAADALALSSPDTESGVSAAAALRAFALALALVLVLALVLLVFLGGFAFAAVGVAGAAGAAGFAISLTFWDKEPNQPSA
jgi:small-conductance mechanosensitive channel